MTTREFRTLTTVESALVKEGNKELLPLIIKATNSDGYYLSLRNERLYPVFVEDSVKVINIDYPQNCADFFNGAVSSYAYEIDPSLLPADLSGNGEGTEANCYHTVKSSGFAVLEKGGKLVAHQMDSSNFGGGYSDGFSDAIAAICNGKGVAIKEVPAGAEKMEGDVFLDINGRTVGKQAGLIVLSGMKNGAGFLRFRSSDKSIEKAVPGKKSPLFSQINNVNNGVEVLARPVFTTANGLTICDPVRIISQW